MVQDMKNALAQAERDAEAPLLDAMEGLVLSFYPEDCWCGEPDTVGKCPWCDLRALLRAHGRLGEGVDDG
jgi:hypothetical protein